MEEDFSVYNGEGTELRKAQMRMLDIMLEIDKVCRRHDIPYWLDFGTLLGAVRHKGFIPWDDDADITIFKKDSDRLVQYLEQELPDHYFVFSEKTSGNFKNKGFFRVVDKRSQICKVGQDESHMDDEGNAINVDVFNIEKGRTGFKKRMNNVHGKAARRIKHTIEDGRLNLMLAYVIYPVTSALIWLYRLLMHIWPTGNYIYNIPNCVVKQMFSQRKKKQILPLGTAVFEGQEFCIPACADAFLKETYGDYMQIPPKDKRVVHTTCIKISDSQ